MSYNYIPLPQPVAFQKINGKDNLLIVLKNKNNVQAAFTNYGARWVSMLVPDVSGNFTDVVVGFDSIDGYFNSTEAYYGAVVGRYANRIAKGKFNLDGKNYSLAINNPPNHLHGGIKGFHDCTWDIISSTENSLLLRYISADMEEGYPGKLEVYINYFLTDDDELQVMFTGVTDKPTIISLAHHAFFNLNGQGSGTILDHHLTINADHYTPVDVNSIPYGKIENVTGSAFDFRDGMLIGARIHEPNEQLTNGSGYDHNFVLNPGEDYRLVAVAAGNVSGIKMEVFTSEPGMQLYTGNFMKNENVLKGGYSDGKYGAFCLETQHFPDSPNQPDFPSVVLRPGEKYFSRTGFKFSR